MRLRLAPVGVASAVPSRWPSTGRHTPNAFRGSTSANSLAAPIVMSGEPIAILCSEPLRQPKARIRGRQRLLNLIAQHLSEFAARHVTVNGKHDPPWLVRAKEFISKHASERITLAGVARHVHYSADHFRKRFRDVAGMPFGEYLSRVRVEKSKSRMSDPHKRLADVAFASGFDSISSFNRAFRQHAGMSPTQYRLSLRSSGNPPSSILHPPLSSSPKTAQRNPSNA